MKLAWMKTGVAALVLFAAGSGIAQAHGHGGPRVVFSASVGFPWGYGYYGPLGSPWYGYGYGYPLVAAPVIVQSAPSQPVTYIERQDAAPAAPVAPAAAPSAPGNSYWYFCRNPEGYYPYVKSCQVAWQPVAAQPPQN